MVFRFVSDRSSATKKSPRLLPEAAADGEGFAHFLPLPVKGENGLFRQIPVLNLIQDPPKLKTIGNHIRKRRLDLGLKQKEVSRIIGVTRAMISAWEMNPVEPAVKHIPKIIAFLGYVPFERGESLGQRITVYRKTLGLSHYQLAKKLGVAPCTIMNWEHNRVKNVEKKIRPYLDGLVEFD